MLRMADQSIVFLLTIIKFCYFFYDLALLIIYHNIWVVTMYNLYIYFLLSFTLLALNLGLDS